MLLFFKLFLFSRASDLPGLSYPIDHRFAPPNAEAQENKKNINKSKTFTIIMKYVRKYRKPVCL